MADADSAIVYFKQIFCSCLEILYLKFVIIISTSGTDSMVQLLLTTLVLITGETTTSQVTTHSQLMLVWRMYAVV